MKRMLFLCLLLSATTAKAGTDIATSASGVTLTPDGLNAQSVQSMLDAQTQEIVSKMPAAQPPSPAADLSGINAKLDALSAAIAKLVVGAPTPTPTPTPVPVPAAYPVTGGGTGLPMVVMAVQPKPASAPLAMTYVAELQPAADEQLLEVGKGKAYKTFSDAVAAQKGKALIKIWDSLDNDSAPILNDARIWCAPGVKLTWSAGTAKRIAWAKAIINMEASNLEVDNCELVGAVVSGAEGGNAAGIRLNPKVQTFVANALTVHDSQDGILGGAALSSTVTNSAFYNNGVGGNGQIHNVYFNELSNAVTVTNSYFGAVHIGNVIKSRAKSTTLLGNVFDSTGDDASWEIDIPNCGSVQVLNSVIVKSAQSSQHYFLSFGSEGCKADGRVNSYEFGKNIVIDDGPIGYLFFAGASAAGTPYNFHDNVYVGPIGTKPAQVNQTVFATRVAGGYAAVPALPQALK